MKKSLIWLCLICNVKNLLKCESTCEFFYFNNFTFSHFIKCFLKWDILSVLFWVGCLCTSDKENTHLKHFISDYTISQKQTMNLLYCLSTCRFDVYANVYKNNKLSGYEFPVYESSRVFCATDGSHLWKKRKKKDWKNRKGGRKGGRTNW